MKDKFLLMLCCLLSLFFGSTSYVYGIGISPGRCTKTMGENEDVDFGMQYYLIRPNARYSCFDAFGTAGLIATVTGCSSSTGVEVLNDQSILIDWNSVESFSWGGYEVVTASINVKSPDSWQCPVLPGCSYMGDLVRHIEMAESGSGMTAVCAAVSELRYIRNFALKAEICGTKDEYLPGEEVNFTANVTDYYRDLEWLFQFNFSYSIDWESDGVIDESLDGIHMTDELGQTDNLTKATGFKFKDLELEHIYSEPGDYMITLNLSDRVETTSIQIPIHVVPEPATFSVLALSSLIVLKKRQGKEHA